MAKAPLDIPAVAGSLSHSHFNCTMRNILGRKKGCECPMQETCKCNLPVICDDQGMFNLALVKAKDEEWGELCEKGHYMGDAGSRHGRRGARGRPCHLDRAEQEE